MKLMCNYAAGVMDQHGVEVVELTADSITERNAEMRVIGRKLAVGLATQAMAAELGDAELLFAAAKTLGEADKALLTLLNAELEVGNKG